MGAKYAKVFGARGPFTIRPMLEVVYFILVLWFYFKHNFLNLNLCLKSDVFLLNTKNVRRFKTILLLLSQFFWLFKSPLLMLNLSNLCIYLHALIITCGHRSSYLTKTANVTEVAILFICYDPVFTSPALYTPAVFLWWQCWWKDPPCLLNYCSYCHLVRFFDRSSPRHHQSNRGCLWDDAKKISLKVWSKLIKM